MSFIGSYYKEDSIISSTPMMKILFIAPGFCILKTGRVLENIIKRDEKYFALMHPGLTHATVESIFTKDYTPNTLLYHLPSNIDEPILKDFKNLRKQISSAGYQMIYLAYMDKCSGWEKQEVMRTRLFHDVVKDNNRIHKKLNDIYESHFQSFLSGTLKRSASPRPAALSVNQPRLYALNTLDTQNLSNAHSEYNAFREHSFMSSGSSDSHLVKYNASEKDGSLDSKKAISPKDLLWSFDLAAFTTANEIPKNEILPCLGMRIFEYFNVAESLGLHGDEGNALMESWFNLVANHYFSEYNEFHNATHVANVLQAVAALLIEDQPIYDNMAEMCCRLDDACLLISAVIFLLEHPGRSVGYLKNINHPIVQAFEPSEKKILQRFHFDKYLQLMAANKHYDILQNLPSSDEKLMLDSIGKLVLSVDLDDIPALEQQYKRSFCGNDEKCDLEIATQDDSKGKTSKLHVPEKGEGSGSDLSQSSKGASESGISSGFSDDSDAFIGRRKIVLYKIFLNFAHMSYTCRSLGNAISWAQKRCRELVNQTETELRDRRDLSLPDYNPRTFNFAKVEAQFCRGTVLPIVNLLSRHYKQSELVSEILENFARNKLFWNSQLCDLPKVKSGESKKNDSKKIINLHSDYRDFEWVTM